MRRIVEKTKLFLFDMDGTLYLGDRLYDFTPALLTQIRQSGGRYLFMTNNSSKSVADYIKKLCKLGISATREDFITSSQATAYYLKRHHPGKKLYVCGTQSLIAELASEGFTVTDDLSQVECVVMGFDTELTFQKLWDVSKLLSENKDLPYIATNPDLVCPTEFGSVPDCGSVCDMLYNVSKRRPLFIGKPEPLMVQYAMSVTGFAPEETVMIGDRLYTDIAAGNRAGVDSLCVLSGEATLQDVRESPDRPTYLLTDVGVLAEIIAEN